MDSFDYLDYLKKNKLSYDNTSLSFSDYKKRFIYDKIINRLNIIYGLRGTGKTTILFQKYLETKNQKIYFNSDELKVLKLNLLELIEKTIYLFGDKTEIFIDEINSIEGWADIIKIAYDKFPKVKFYITGSSAINLIESKKQLARRAVYYELKPLSFREFIYINEGIKLDELSSITEKDIVLYDIYIKEKLKNVNLIEYFSKYTRNNLTYLLENPNVTLQDMVERIIYQDIANSKGNILTNTLTNYERLILILSQSTSTNYENISKDLEISKSQVKDMLTTLESSGLIIKVFPYKKGRAGVRKQWKYYFTVPAIRMHYANKLNINESDLQGYVNEDIFVSNFRDVYYSNVDFVWNKFLVEIGNTNKDFSQFKGEKLNYKKIIVYNGLKIETHNDGLKVPSYIWYLQI